MKGPSAGLKMKASRAGLETLERKEIYEPGGKWDLPYWMNYDWNLADGFTELKFRNSNKFGDVSGKWVETATAR